jgi:hypothetical protein
MLVDIDHNDSDDRLAIILLAFQAGEKSVGCCLLHSTPVGRGI